MEAAGRVLMGRSMPSDAAPRNVAALIAMIDTRRRRAFAWRGGRDCVSFAALAVKAQTGIDPRGELRWRSRREARLLLASCGGLEAAMDARFNRVAPAMAKRGDIAALPCDEFGVRLMVVEGTTLVGPGDEGLERLPRAMMIIAWDAASVTAGDL